MKRISENPSIIDKMRKNMSKNKNNEAMEKLYKIVVVSVGGVEIVKIVAKPCAMRFCGIFDL